MPSSTQHGISTPLLTETILLSFWRCSLGYSPRPNYRSFHDDKAEEVPASQILIPDVQEMALGECGSQASKLFPLESCPRHQPVRPWLRIMSIWPPGRNDRPSKSSKCCSQVLYPLCSNVVGCHLGLLGAGAKKTQPLRLQISDSEA